MSQEAATSEIVTEENITATSAETVEAEPETSQDRWITTWTAAPLKMERAETPRRPMLAGNTLRQVAHISLGGEKFTFTFSNEYSYEALDVEAVYISKLVEAGKSNIDTGTTVRLTFNGGEQGFSLKGGEVITSDPVEFCCQSLGNIAVSMEFGDNVPMLLTGHSFAGSSCWVSKGRCAADEVIDAITPLSFRYILTKIDVWNETGAGVIVCLGDSITDGVGSDENKFNDYPNTLAALLQADEDISNYAVVNAGIGGNKFANTGCVGDMGITRYKRDVLGVEGAEYVIVFIGTNDVGAANESTVPNMLVGYQKLVQDCHEKGLKVYAATITPLKLSAYDTDYNRQILAELNEYLKSDDSVFDGVIDFYAAVEDPENPGTVAEEYNCHWGDYLHLGPKGYEKLAQTAFEFLKNQMD